MTALKKFEDFVSFELYLAFHAKGQSHDEMVAARERLVMACQHYMEYLRDQEALRPVEVVSGYDIDFMTMWNDFVGKKNFLNPEHDLYALATRNRLMGYFVDRLVFPPFAYYLSADRAPEKAEEQKYLLICEAFNQGSFDLNDVIHSILTDTEAGGRIACMFKNWMPQFGTLNSTGNELTLEPLKDRAPYGVQHIELELKTGNLLICNRLAEIRALKDILDTRDIDINSTKGTIEYTEMLAKHGILQVFVGNTCPNVYQREGAVIVGQHNEDEHEIENAGMVITDLWWVTLVERETLEALVAGKYGPEKAKKVVEEFISMNHGEVKQINVNPGTHHLYFHGYYEKLAGELDTEEVITNAVEPYFVLSERTLGLKQEQRPAPRPKI